MQEWSDMEQARRQSASPQDRSVALTYKTPTVIEITVLFKFDWSNLSRESAFRIVEAIGRKALRAKQTPKSLSYIVTTTESPLDLVKRLRAKLDDLTFIENVWAQIVGRDAVGLHGSMDPFQAFVGNAWAEVDRLIEARAKATPRQAKHVERVRPPNTRVEDRVEQLYEPALVDVPPRGRWKRDKTRRAYDPER